METARGNGILPTCKPAVKVPRHVATSVVANPWWFDGLAPAVRVVGSVGGEMHIRFRDLSWRVVERNKKQLWKFRVSYIKLERRMEKNLIINV